MRSVRKDERKYYESLLQYSREHLMVHTHTHTHTPPSPPSPPSQLYPYHLQDMLVEGLRVTPFAYYSGIMADIMLGEKSYDSLPNFTAADCKPLLVATGQPHPLTSPHAGLRLMGIGRNQYIDLMNQYRAKVVCQKRRKSHFLILSFLSLL